MFAVLDDGKILLTRQEQPGKDPFIGALGGRLDEGEDVVAAAKRELLEESGYEASELVLWDARQPASKIDWAVYTFIAKGLKKVSDQKLDAGERVDLMPVTFDELVEIATTNSNFRETEMIPHFFKAKLDVEKKMELMKLFEPKELEEILRI